MNIIIAGGGKVGQTLARQLAAEGHSLTIIDRDDAILQTSTEQYDAMAVEGNCVATQVLLRSGVKAAGCREVLVRWRYAANSRSFNKVQSAKNRWKIYRHYLKLPLAQSAWHFCEYVIASLKKYGKSA